MPKIAIALAAVLGLATPVSAQTAAPQPAPTTQGGLGDLGDLSGLGGAGGLGGLLGSSLPGVGSIGAGNAAGLLGYCLKNNLLGQGGALAGLAGTRGTTPSTAAPATGARSIFERLAGKQGVQASPGYQEGQTGQVVTPNGQGLALGDLGGKLKTRLCSIVLNRAKSFL